MEDEIWKDIERYEGAYQISSFGDVKSLRRKDSSGRRWLKERILKPRLDRYGYYHLGLSIKGRVSDVKVHRLVALAFIPNPESKPEVNHKSGIKTCNEVTNLEWVTNKENVIHRDTILKKHTKGEHNGRSKLIRADILQIRDSLLPRRKLAEIFNVTPKYISNIKNRKNWKHI